jgi:hypothetical protein
VNDFPDLVYASGNIFTKESNMKRKTRIKGAGTLESLHRDFCTWRENRNKREAIPSHLLKRAVELSRIHGFTAVSRHLKINYMTLKNYADRATATRCKSGVAKGGELSFLELRLDKEDVHTVFNPICEITLERPDGGRIKLCLAHEPSVTLMQIIKNL